MDASLALCARFSNAIVFHHLRNPWPILACRILRPLLPLNAERALYRCRVSVNLKRVPCSLFALVSLLILAVQCILSIANIHPFPVYHSEAKTRRRMVTNLLKGFAAISQYSFDVVSGFRCRLLSLELRIQPHFFIIHPFYPVSTLMYDSVVN